MIAMLCLEELAVDRKPRLELATKRGDWRTYARYINVPKTWVAEITGRAPGKKKYERSFLRGARDYTNSNSTGSRGVERWYELHDRAYYEVSEPVSWNHGRRYLCRAIAGNVIEVTEEEVEAWLDAGCPDLTSATAAAPPPETVAPAHATENQHTALDSHSRVSIIPPCDAPMDPAPEETTR